MSTSTTVAFIGLGNMGGPMAANLVAAGRDVTGFDVGQEACDRAREAGVDVKGSAAEAVHGAGSVVTMLPNGALLLSVYDEVLAAAAPSTLFVDCSTVAVSDARTAADRAVAAGHRAADAPVSGGVGGAEAGTLTFMLGCDDALLEEATALLDPMAGRVVHCGASGAGQAAKICNNMVLGASMIAISEAFVLGEKLGLTHQAFFDVASTASGQCWALTTNCPVPGPVPTSPANRDWKPGFAGALMAKDLGLARRAVEESGTDAAVGTLAEELYRRFADEGGAGLDFSAIVNTIRERSATAAG
ncbi:3-hydroxyisobutyrate dehydrogenase [Nocardioides sp. Arc9.136]|uniref:3-hydroxyisobutyrate dehydrogenase n=1 Tax=Nocardioides sp. Arc9.136 TaxID=2996826 RepID=UPI0026664FE9|nr:3-hydroxyisobutyrate dehydrogenase [Nocardioides sp. Arc9.136]WKN47049.1 3-hydroxyisobutyrate dehydrogenase [Nocardioides sp. Arc9.136]